MMERNRGSIVFYVLVTIFAIAIGYLVASQIDLRNQLAAREMDSAARDEVIAVLAADLRTMREERLEEGEEPSVPDPEELIEDIPKTEPLRGLQGLRGPVGLQGPRGLQGPQGEQGLMGPQGFMGFEGLQGIPGEQGPVGIQGESITGSQGEPGATGAQGEAGEIGPQGIQGEEGPQGEEGSQGEEGAQGPQGPPGMVCIAGFTAQEVIVLTGPPSISETLWACVQQEEGE